MNKENIYKYKLDVDVAININTNTSESDLRRQLLKQLKRKPPLPLRLQRDLNPWPPRYQCDALPTMKPRRKQVRYEFKLYPLYEENEMICIFLGTVFKSYFTSAKITFTCILYPQFKCILFTFKSERPENLSDTGCTTFRSGAKLQRSVLINRFEDSVPYVNGRPIRYGFDDATESYPV